jgi:hypothetical protein
MKIVWQDLVWQLLIGLLVIFFGGRVVGGVVNLAAMASPQMVSTIFCPSGSTATWNSEPNQGISNGSSISCRDQNGASVPTLTDAESITLERKYFYRPSYILMVILVIGWFIRSSFGKRGIK